ncbi:MAG: hypothetical protein Q8O99_06785 [bacterium]|nr:hypothetical protein [bacterium]
MDDLTTLRTEIETIKSRNKKVAADKARETSRCRRILVASLTYIIISLVFYSLDIERPWVNALIPTIGFLLSTLSVSTVKRIWLRYVYKG